MAVKTLWTFLPFSQVPYLDPEPLNQILENALNRLTDLVLRMFSRECADPHLFKYWKRILQDILAEIFQSHRMFQHDWLAMKKSLTVFLNHTVYDVFTGKPERLSRSVVGAITGSMLGSERSRFFLRPLFQPWSNSVSCFVDKLFVFGSTCKEQDIEKLKS